MARSACRDHIRHRREPSRRRGRANIPQRAGIVIELWTFGPPRAWLTGRLVALRRGLVVRFPRAGFVAAQPYAQRPTQPLARASILTGAPLMPAPKRRRAISVDASALEGLVGRYLLAPEVWVTVTRKGNRLFGQLTGLEGAEIFAESPTRFFSKAVDAQVTFKLGPDGRAVSLVLQQSGRDLPAERCADTPSAE